MWLVGITLFIVFLLLVLPWRALAKTRHSLCGNAASAR
jgi:hypothetical protein